jgi:hypothetical protein
MKLVYEGPHDGVDIHLPSGIVRTVMRGDEVDVPDDVGESLLTQGDNFKAAKRGGKGDAA